MISLPKSRAAIGTPEFETAFKAELATMGRELPLQAGLTSGSFALDEPIEIMLLATAETTETIDAKIVVFYQSLTPGCACAGDPTVESEQNERVTALVSINRASAEAVVRVVDD